MSKSRQCNHEFCLFWCSEVKIHVVIRKCNAIKNSPSMLDTYQRWWHVRKSQRRSRSVAHHRQCRVHFRRAKGIDLTMDGQGIARNSILFCVPYITYFSWYLSFAWLWINGRVESSYEPFPGCLSPDPLKVLNLVLAKPHCLWNCEESRPPPFDL